MMTASTKVDWPSTVTAMSLLAYQSENGKFSPLGYWKLSGSPMASAYETMFSKPPAANGTASACNSTALELNDPASNTTKLSKAVSEPSAMASLMW